GYGMALAGIKLIYSFFDFTTVLDFIVFIIAGFVIGRMVAEKTWVLTIGLAFPTFLLCVFFLIQIGYQPLSNGVGTSYAWSLLVVPIATCVGIVVASYFK
ncbi:MAG TPA: hypothetical protein VLR29_01690, partial [Flavobacterium sp.]|nr:hypothetical protein [Flavobacterium sp.]